MLCSFLMFSQQSNCIFHADSSSVWIQGNDIRAKIMAGTFNFGFDYGFQVPYDSSRAIQQNAFGNSSLWFAGLEQNSGNLLKYSPLLNNSLGALDNLGNLDSNFCAFYNKVWMVES